jgi:ADP-heptose:LPS heptosyltransferase
VLQGNPHLSELIVAPKRRGVARVRDDVAIARRLWRGRFDVAVDLHGGPRAAWFAWASGAPMRIGYRIAGRSWMYTHVVERAADLAPRHSVRNQFDLLAPLGINLCDPALNPVEMADDPVVTARLEQRLRDADIGPEHELAVIHVSAGNAFRRWPVDSFTTLVTALAGRDPNRRVMLLSGPSDRAAAEAVARGARERLGAAGRAVAWGEFDPAEIRALAARAAVYIGGDSGPLHVAATTRTPIVQLFGPTLPERSMPWRSPAYYAEAVDMGSLRCRPCHQRTCEPGDFRCLTGITPERVVAAAERAMHR